jgi:CheY-like chemotaxis protein
LYIQIENAALLSAMKSGPILLADDDADDRLFVESVCQSLHYKNAIVQFENGQQLLDYLLVTKEKPFLILCDINMPMMNGLEVRRKIEEHEFLRRKSIPFVFFSTNAVKREVEIAFELTVQGFFEKGSTLQQLTDRLRIILEYWMVCHHPNA